MKYEGNPWEFHDLLVVVHVDRKKRWKVVIKTHIERKIMKMLKEVRKQLCKKNI